MLKKINITVLIAMGLTIVLSILNVVLKWEVFAIPGIPFAIFNFMLLLALTFLPQLLKKLSMTISNGLYYLILFSVIVSFVGGMVYKLFQIIPYYDTVIHCFNGGLIAIVGFAFIRSQFTDWREHLLLITIGAILISISVGTIWEIYEFVADLVTGGNMQRHSNIFTDDRIPIPFEGQKALMDTMTDIIVDTVGAIIGAIIMHRSVLNNETLIKAFRLDHIENKK